MSSIWWMKVGRTYVEAAGDGPLTIPGYAEYGGLV